MHKVKLTNEERLILLKFAKEREKSIGKSRCMKNTHDNAKALVEKLKIHKSG